MWYKYNSNLTLQTRPNYSSSHINVQLIKLLVINLSDTIFATRRMTCEPAYRLPISHCQLLHYAAVDRSTVASIMYSTSRNNYILFCVTFLPTLKTKYLPA